MLFFDKLLINDYNVFVLSIINIIMINNINSEPVTQEKTAEERELTNGELYELKFKEAVYFRFLSLKEKVEAKRWISYRKWKENSWLHFSVIDKAKTNSIIITDYTQKHGKIHVLTLSFNSDKKEFNLSEVLWVNRKDWNNIPVSMVMNFLDEVENKMNSYHNNIIDNTRLEIWNTISGMFSDGKKRRFG